MVLQTSVHRPADDDLLAAISSILRQRVADVLVVPGVHRGALENIVLRVDGEQFRKGVAREGIGLDRGDRGRDVEDLGGLGKADDIVLQYLAVDRLDAERHLRLLVDEDELAVRGVRTSSLDMRFSSSVVWTANAAGYKLDRACWSDTMSWNTARKALSGSKPMLPFTGCFGC